MRLALLLNAVSPAIGGVLVRGEKGTAKSTAVRALAAVLPPVDVVDRLPVLLRPGRARPVVPGRPARRRRAGGDACRPGWSSCPSGSTEDRLTGSLDVERALTEGVTTFQPGLLASAHRGVLYVDEVNLLHDHLVDLLLDAAALGTNYVERDGVSVRHAARFLLVGTMNPEEGELRPQLLDRFGLTVEVVAPREPKLRAEVVRRRMAFDADPPAFAGALRRRGARAGRIDRRGPRAAALGGADRRGARADRRGLRGLRRRRPAGRHRHRPRRRRARRLARPRHRHGRRCPRRGSPRAAAPTSPQPVRRARTGRPATRRRARRRERRGSAGRRTRPGRLRTRRHERRGRSGRRGAAPAVRPGQPGRSAAGFGADERRGPVADLPRTPPRSAGYRRRCGRAALARRDRLGPHGGVPAAARPNPAPAPDRDARRRRAPPTPARLARARA